MRTFLALSLLLLGLMGAAACGSKGTPGTGGTPCPIGAPSCWTSRSCPAGSYCTAADPCGDYASCVPIPSACAASPSCACLIANSGQMGVGVTLGCEASGTTFFVDDEGGDSPCCP